MKHTRACALSVTALLAGIASAQTPPKKFHVDLSEETVDHRRLERGDQDDQTQGREWYENIEIWGHAAAGFLDTGRTGYRPEGAFMVREANLFVRAQASERVAAQVEIQFARAGVDDDEARLHTDEVYVEIRNLLESQPELLNVKIGAVDIPFGEEYLRRDAIDLPTINYSAASPYGVDEGVVFFGRIQGVEWFAAVMDGTAKRSMEDSDDKAVAVKAAGDLTESLYVSGSVMRTGDTALSANCFGGMYLAPVGAKGTPSTLGVSPSKQISATLYEVDAVLEGGDFCHVRGSFGQAFVDDDVAAFDRDLTWGFLEGSVQITGNTYVAARYSEFGTYDDDEGYAINGKLTGASFEKYGWDVNRLQRIGVTFGYHPHKNLWVKAEVGRDRFWVIDGSPFRPGSDHREYFAFEVVVGF